MASPNFIDYVKVYVRAGRGGAGAIHFRKEKFVPKGGPDGGDGGRGGHVILRCNKQLSTLLHLKYKKHIVGSNGKPGEGGCRTGANGKDIILNVPLGTVVKSATSGEVLLEVLADKKKYLLMEGGRGGLGNAHFKSPRQQAPRFSQGGLLGQEAAIIIELKLLADVGLVGFPNVGKSTLLSVLSAARPKIASYPFTTLVPNLGVVSYRDSHSFVMADIPGIIQGAALGKGLGTRFLRHIERNSVLLFMVTADVPHIGNAYDLLVQELVTHNPDLLTKPRLLAISKMDLLDSAAYKKVLLTLPIGIDCVPISAVSGLGITDLKDAIWHKLH